MKKFADVTLLHGFGHIYQSPHFTEAIWFCLLIVISAVMICRDAALLIQRYEREETTTKLAVVRNESITVAQPTFCFLPDTFDMTTDWRNRPTVSFDSSCISQFLVTFNVSETLELVKSEWQNLTKLLQTHTYSMGWWEENKNQTTLVYLMLSEIIRWEYSMTQDYIYLYKVEMNQDTLEAVQEIQKYFIQQQYDFGQLTEFVSSVVCNQLLQYMDFTQNISGIERKMMMFRPGSSSTANNQPSLYPFALATNICQVGKLSCFGGTDLSDTSHLICYKYPIDLTFRSTKDLAKIWFKDAKTPSPGCQAYLDITGQSAYLMNETSDSSIQMCGGSKMVRASVGYDVLSYSKRADPCADGNRVDCLLKCREDFLIDKCKCFPVSIMSNRQKPQNLPYCSEVYSIVNGEKQRLILYTAKLVPFTSTGNGSCNYDSQALDNCRSACNRLCHQRKFSFLYIYEDPKDNDLSNLTLSFGSFTYLYFEESLTMIWSDYIMTFGGSIGFWMGGSIIAFLHIPVYLLRSSIKTIIECRKKKRSKIASPPIDAVQAYSVSDHL